MNGCCCCAANGERNVGDVGNGDGGALSTNTSMDLRCSSSGEGARLCCGVSRGASPSPSSTIQREGSHFVASSPQTFGLEWRPVALIDIRVPCGIAYVRFSKVMGWSAAVHLFVMPVGEYIRSVSDCNQGMSVSRSMWLYFTYHDSKGPSSAIEVRFVLQLSAAFQGSSLIDFIDFI